MAYPDDIEISEEKYIEFRDILHKEHGKFFSPEEAREIADELVGFYLHLIRMKLGDKLEPKL